MHTVKHIAKDGNLSSKVWKTCFDAIMFWNKSAVVKRDIKLLVERI